MVVSSPQCDEKDSLFPVFPLTGYTAKAFCRLSLWSFKEKASTISYGTAFNESGITICIVNIVLTYQQNPAAEAFAKASSAIKPTTNQGVPS
ncbi:hypothetical protein [Bilophila sp.]|uniref:hypothetical protein n=1 Tax=Bilophila sp. TaxID=1929485 RepID=UPI003076BE7B